MMSTGTALSVLASLLAMLWLYRGRHISPVLLVVLVLVWLTGNIEMLLTELGNRLPEGLIFITADSLDYATKLYNYGFLAMALGMRLGCHRQNILTAMSSGEQRGHWMQRAQGLGAVHLYVLLFLLTFPLELLMHGPLRSFTQLLLPLMSLRFFPVFMLAHDYFRYGRYGALLLGVSVFEIVINLSFFNSFQALFVVIACAMMLALMTSGYRKLLLAALVGALMFGVLSVWSYMKPDFRAYLTAEAVSQTDTRDTVDKIDFALNQIRGMSIEDFQYGMSKAVARVAYNSYFAATTYNVPAYREFTNGTALIDAIRYALMPRFLFPDKPIIDDSVIAGEITGMYVSGAESATSINIGLFGELYADLGRPWMFFAFGLIGFFMARMEGYIFTKIGSTREALAFSAIFIGVFGSGVYSLPKFVGAMIYLFAAMFVFFSYFYHQMRKA